MWHKDIQEQYVWRSVSGTCGTLQFHKKRSREYQNANGTNATGYTLQEEKTKKGRESYAIAGFVLSIVG